MNGRPRAAVEHDRQRDERDEQVGPAVGPQEERQAAPGGNLSGHGTRSIGTAVGGPAPAARRVSRAGRRSPAPSSGRCRRPARRRRSPGRGRRCRPSRRRRACRSRCRTATALRRPSTASAALSSDSGRGLAGGPIGCSSFRPATPRSSATVPSFCAGVSTVSLIVIRRSWWSFSPVQMSTPALLTALATAPLSLPMPVGSPAIALSPVPPALDSSLSRSLTSPGMSTSALRWTTFVPSSVSTPSSWTFVIQPRGSTPSAPRSPGRPPFDPVPVPASCFELGGRERERALAELHPALLAGRDDPDRELPVARGERDVEGELRRAAAGRALERAAETHRQRRRDARRGRPRARRCRASGDRC